MAFFNDSLSNQNLSIPHSAISPNNYVHEDAAETLPISSNTILDSSADKNKRLVMNKRKRSKRPEVDGEIPRDVIHVRAKRGQATDSHSLAERVRREKINEKLRYLQELVPGCYKTMGMAVMLDVIIDYVQSLQQQIEFLSMKLTAATMQYDFSSSEYNFSETFQRNNISTSWQVQEMERMGGEGYINPTWPLY